MITHHIKVSPSKVALPKSDQLAWKIAAVATDKTAIDAAAGEMVINRIIDNAAVALAAINRTPVANARTQALAHPRTQGATVFGLPASQQFDCEWAAWANGVAVRELDMHDTFLAADYSHPGDNIPPLLAVAQQCGRTGADLLRGLLVGYEIQMDLVRAICLHEYKKDHIAHLCPSAAAGIGAMLGLNTDTVYQAVQQAVHVGFSTRQSRKGEISSWKAYAPAHAGKLAIEAVDRAMRGEKSPSPIYEGEDSVIAWMLGGKNASYNVPLPAPGEPCRAILDSYTKEHSAEYQAQAWIDLAFKLRSQIPDLKAIREIIIHTSHHTHYVIGTGAGDPQKSDPNASRETLDHSIMFIFASALHTGFWHHVKSYAPEIAKHPDVIALWKKITTREDAEWTRRYHSTDPNEKAFGGRVEIIFNDSKKITDEIAVANAHPLGAKPFVRADYIHKFEILTEDVISFEESVRFLDLVQRLPQLTAAEVCELNVALPPNKLTCATRDQRGIF
ncbi:MAG TPA: MmgE/PrpD family protein [Candidatus Acidoferrales bacterium]|jgi:2-methylcitrate dehydratase|nr:MmgE/PrpD family protein [Candidatus Acidoferrales bacterium]